jgi:hypothetical protein
MMQPKVDGALAVLDTLARIVQLGGAPALAGRVAQMRAAFEAKTGAFAPEDPWFEERSRAFWNDAATREAFGREVVSGLTPDQARWLAPLERAHRGLFRFDAPVFVDLYGVPAGAVGEHHAADRRDRGAREALVLDCVPAGRVVTFRGCGDPGA